jgi:protein-disulfide isomerase
MAKVKKVSKNTDRSDFAVDYQPPVKRDFSALYSPILVVLLIVASFFLGRLSLEVSNLKGGKAVAPTPVAPNAQPQEAQRPITAPAMKELAKKLGMDSGKFDSCLDNGTYAQRVSDELKEGQELGVSGTPSFFINGVMLVGAQPQSTFETIIEAELKNGTGDAEAKKLGEDGLRKKVSYGTGPIKGAANAKIKVMEFTDFECPFCERAFPTVEAIMKKYEGKISLEYRSYPLPFHPLAQKAAEGALCANDQGKFWEMRDAMFAASK